MATQESIIENLVTRRMGNSVSSTGRWFNAITGIKRELRQAIRLAGEALASVDLVSCQPAMLAFLMQSVCPSRGVKGVASYKHSQSASECPPLTPACWSGGSLLRFSEVSEYRERVCGGTFYESVFSSCGMDRSEAKRRFLVDVLAPRFRYPSPVRSAFEAAFPSVGQFICHVNQRDHGELIRLLQRLESWLVVETVAPRLVGQCPFITLHDAIFCGPGDIPLVQEAFEDVFADIGFTMRMKEESWHGRSVAA